MLLLYIYINCNSATEMSSNTFRLYPEAKCLVGLYTGGLQYVTCRTCDIFRVLYRGSCILGVHFWKH